MADDGKGGGTPPANDAVTDAMVERIIDRLGQGDKDRALRALIDDNHKYRERHRDDQNTMAQLTKQIDEHKLSEADAKLLAAVKDAKLTVETVPTLLTELGELRTFRTTTDRNARVVEAATLAGYKPSVLTDVLAMRGLDVVMQDTRVAIEGKDNEYRTERRPYVRPAADDKATPTPLVEYVADKLADFLPALTASDAGSGSPGGGSNGRAGPGVPFTAQPSSRGTSSSGKAKNDVDAALNRHIGTFYRHGTDGSKEKTA